MTTWHDGDWAKVSPAQIAAQCSPRHIQSVLEHAQHDLVSLQARCAALEVALRNAAGSIHGALDDWRKTREICLSDLEQALYDANGVIHATPGAPAQGAKNV